MTLFADTLPVDHDSRERIRTDLDRNLFVEAGAGTGKTRVLVERVVRLVASARVSNISRLVAITFTEAAAAELRDRIRIALERAAHDLDLPDDERLRCAEARAHIDRATITTLHGFAQRILAEHPLDVGLAPVFEIDDDVRARVRFVERWTRFRDELFDDESAATDLLRLHALGFSTDRLRDVAQLLHQRWDALVGVSFPVPPPPAIAVQSIVEPVREAEQVAAPHWHRNGDKLVELVDEWSALAQALDEAAKADDALEVIRVLAGTRVWKPSYQGKAELWGADKPVVLGHLGAANTARTELLDALRTTVLQRFMPRLQGFTLAGVEQRRADGRLEFHDLLVHARDLLRADTGVRVALANRVDVILIDEFQDTDPLQLDIAFALAADDPAQPPPHWTQARLRPGKILLVGDPKQSIYRFRGADISLWSRTKALFSDGVEQLGQNFRTVPPLLEWVNRVFRAVIAEGEEGAQPAYHDLAPFRPEVREGPAVVVVGEPHDDARAAALRELEADDLARLIVEMKVGRWEVEDLTGGGGCRPARFDDIAILVPTRTPLAQLERALDARDVPYRVESRSLVWATDAVRELLAMLAAIDDPADDISVVAALRAPGFACSDTDLVEWRLADGTWDHRVVAPSGVVFDHPVARAMAALASYHRARWDLPVDQLVERVIRERRLIELTFALRRPRDHWRRLRFVLDQARAFVEAGGASLGDFVAWARLQSDEGAMIVETPAPEPDDDAVRILTIHGSKGLEFPVVVLAGLASAGRAVGPWVLYGDAGPEVAMGPAGARCTTPGYDELAARQGNADLHEAHRLLYVAATRARDHLVVGLHHSTRGQSTPARDLWAVCQDAAVGWWKPAEFGDQLPLPVSEGGGAFVPASIEQRDAWLVAHDAVLARAGARRVVAATAMAHLDEQVETMPLDDGAPSALPSTIFRGGTALGRAVHAVLATVDLDRPDDEEIAALSEAHAAAEGVTPPVDVERRVRAALGAPSVVAARAASRRWRELYVSAPVGDGGRLVEGYLDLLYEDDAGDLVVIDYKTDADVESAVDHYRLQAATYALALQIALGRRVARAAFVFCRAHEAIEREVDDLDAAIAEVRALVG
ncbi:MAG TPA: UvrD-helicase domain-containing protein [Acidimicrobiales bacterium]|nr:UvrD-helicase domain-containing protein [Acidimicrobiales bacterium]